MFRGLKFEPDAEIGPSGNPERPQGVGESQSDV